MRSSRGSGGEALRKQRSEKDQRPKLMEVSRGGSAGLAEEDDVADKKELTKMKLPEEDVEAEDLEVGEGDAGSERGGDAGDQLNEEGHEGAERAAEAEDEEDS